MPLRSTNHQPLEKSNDFVDRYLTRAVGFEHRNATERKGDPMEMSPVERSQTRMKVKTFTSELKPFHTMGELEALDDQVNTFLKENDIRSVVSASDTCTTDDSGATIGIIRVIAYQD
jgi:fibronectin type 3 domain-containing protein